MFITNKEKKIIIVVLLIIIFAVVAFLLISGNGIGDPERWTRCGKDLEYHGDVYPTVEIAGMCLFQKNLNTSKYSTGDEIIHAREEGGRNDNLHNNEEIIEKKQEVVAKYRDQIYEEWKRDGVMEEGLEERAERSLDRILKEWEKHPELEDDSLKEEAIRDIFIGLLLDWELEEWIENELEERLAEEKEKSREDIVDWRGATEGLYSYYDHDYEIGETFGKIYNFYAVNDERGLCPEGWRVTTDEDWMKIETQLGMSEDEVEDTRERGREEKVGQKMKSELVWDHVTEEEVGESGLDILPGGLRIGDGRFTRIGTYAFLWTSTEGGRPGQAWIRMLRRDRTGVERIAEPKYFGGSVRCVKDIE